MKKVLSFLFFIMLSTAMANALTVEGFIDYCSNIKEAKVIKANRFNLDDALGMEIESGTMTILREFQNESIVKDITEKLNSITDNKLFPVVNQTNDKNVTKIYLENSKSKKKQLVVITVSPKEVTIVDVFGKINGKFN